MRAAALFVPGLRRIRRMKYQDREMDMSVDHGTSATNRARTFHAPDFRCGVRRPLPRILVWNGSMRSRQMGHSAPGVSDRECLDCTNRKRSTCR
jgi:hypothetical protein